MSATPPTLEGRVAKLEELVATLITSCARQKLRADRLEVDAADLKALLFPPVAMMVERRYESGGLAAHLEGPTFAGRTRSPRLKKFLGAARKGKRRTTSRRTAEGYVRDLGGDPDNPIHLPDPDDLAVVVEASREAV